jgi:protoporphyrin/coproporphyrin ferrochelatase
MNEASPIAATTATALASEPAATAVPADVPGPARVEGGKIGVLLVNLGTPDGADAASVRRYLKEFLSDPRVIENQGVLWQLVLNGVILPIRPRRKARDYAKIWNQEKNESPLKTITRAQAEKLGAALAPQGSRLLVDWAMRYGNPSIASRLGDLVARGCERILVIPLYPQYCAATTATVGDEVFRVLERMRFQPALRIAPPYYDDDAYIEALASTTDAAIAGLDLKPDVILASFHGVPQAYVDKGDPYYTQCLATMRLLRARLGLDEKKLLLTFQSRFGRAQWLEPATDRTVRKLAKEGVKNIAVITPGFSADCLETLEEIAFENAHIFKKHGGANFAAIPCLNDSAPGMEVIRRLALRELEGWV